MNDEQEQDSGGAAGGGSGSNAGVTIRLVKEESGEESDVANSGGN